MRLRLRATAASATPRDVATPGCRFVAEAEEIRDVGGDRVLFLGRIRWRGVASGIETESPFAMVITFRDGKMFRPVDHLSREEALEAVGLSE